MSERPEPRVVWLASYPRSGNSWVRFLFGAYARGGLLDWTACDEAVFDLHNLLGEARRNDYDEAEVFRRVRRRVDARPESDHRIPDPFLKTHFLWSPRHPWGERTHKIIYVVRHPKDVLLSSHNYLQVMKKETRSEQDAARDFIRHRGEPRWLSAFGSWYGHFESWNQHPAHPLLLVRYEDLKRDTLAEFVRMLEFLELPVDRVRAGKVVGETSIEVLRDLEREARQRKGLDRFEEGRYLMHRGRSEQSLGELGDGFDQAFDEAFAGEMERVGYA